VFGDVHHGGDLVAWSGGLSSIRVPYDATGEDGRNYIDLGEEVPPELTDHFTAGLFFRSGAGLIWPGGFDYWAIGITTQGALEIVGRNYIMASPDDTAPAYFRQTLMVFSPPVGADNPPIIDIGNNLYNTYNEALPEPMVFPDPVPKQWIPIPNPSRWDYYDKTGITWEQAFFRKDFLGNVYVGGMLQALTAGGWGAGEALARLPVGCRPDKRRIFTCQGFNNTYWRADVLPTGEITWNGGSPTVSYAVGNYVSLEGIVFEAGN
jgi:hypothetical protein